MKNLSLGVQLRLMELSEDLWGGVDNPLETFIHLSALDLLFIGPMQRRRLIRLQAAILAYLKNPTDSLSRVIFLSSLRACEAASGLLGKNDDARHHCTEKRVGSGSEKIMVTYADSLIVHEDFSQINNSNKTHRFYGDRVGDEVDVGYFGVGHYVESGLFEDSAPSFGSLEFDSQADLVELAQVYQHDSVENIEASIGDPSRGIQEAMLGLLTPDSEPYFGMFFTPDQ
jgi:hypothetical protein